MTKSAVLQLLCLGCFSLPQTVAAATPIAGQTPVVIANIDLSKPFATRSAWRLVATQDPPTADILSQDEDAPGPVHLCLRKAAQTSCATRLDPTPPGRDELWVPHFLEVAKVVSPRGRSSAPLVLLQTASVHSGDGDQVVYRQILAYRRDSDRFEQIYSHYTGRNRNEDVRLLTSGPLAGAVISAEPTENAPFGFWMTVSALTPAYTYRQVLRYRSATHYGDGNPLAVIDSEMPNIEMRLGLWRPGSPLPLPASACPKPRLVHMELWCG